MPDTLAQKVRAKYPGAYDDLSDQQLEAAFDAKYPGAYDDIPRSTARAAPTSQAAPSTSMLDLGVEAVTRYAKGVIPIDLLKNLFNDATGEYTKANEATKRGDVAASLGHTLAASPMGQQVKLLGQLGQAQLAQFGKAKAAYDKGDYEQASAYTVAGFLPLIGPATTAMGEEVRAGRETGDVTRQVGAVAELGGMLTGPKVIGATMPKAVRVPFTGKFANVNPAEVAAVQYGERVGIPIDAATATGNPMVRSAQTMADRSILGAIPAQRAAARQTQALALESGGLENRAYTYPVTPETAGQSLQGTLAGRVSDLATEQRKQYGRLGEIEEANKRPVQVGAETITREFDPADMDPHEALLRAVARNGGIGADKGMPGEIRTLLESRTPAGGALSDRGLLGAQRTGSVGGVGRVTRTGGKNLDTMAEALREEGFDIRGPRELLDALEDARVARMRPKAGPKADVFEEAVMEEIGLPVDIEAARLGFKPVYDRLARKRDIGVPLMGAEARTFAALDRLMTGPTKRAASEVDDLLSDLKAVARAPGMPELRGKGKGAASYAVGALEREVQKAVALGGPEATAARNLGRQATIEKYETGRLLKELRKEPVGAYRKATAPQDTQIDYLRELKAVAPDEMPKIGRAYLSSLFGKATAEGGFGRAQGLQADWQKLGPETKKVLFPDAALRSDLDNFFLLAKKISENPNPSGTAVSWMPIAQAGTAGTLLLVNPLSAATVVLAPAALGKLLRSRTGIRALTEVIRIPTGRSRAAQALAVSRVASMAGVRATPVPAVAESEAARK